MCSLKLNIKPFLVLLTLCSTTLISSQSDPGDIDENLWRSLNSNQRTTNFYELEASFNAFMQNYDSLTAEPEVIKDIKRYQRFQFLWADRVSTDNPTTDGELTNFWEAFQLYMSEPFCETSDNPEPWVDQGPFNYPYHALGRVDCAWINPSNPDIVYLGTPFSGFWKSIDGGQNWYCTTDALRLPGLGCADMAVIEIDSDPNNNIIYLGSGRLEFLYSGIYGPGLLKSTDGGESFSVVETFPQDSELRVHRILVDPNNSNVVYASAKSSIYKTTDGGTTWTDLTASIADPDNVHQFRDMEFDPANSNIIYAGTYNEDTRNGGAQMWKTEDGGVTWTQLLTSGISLPEITMLRHMYYATHANGWTCASDTSPIEISPSGQGSYSFSYLQSNNDWTSQFRWDADYLLNMEASLPTGCRLVIEYFYDGEAIEVYPSDWQTTSGPIPSVTEHPFTSHGYGDEVRVTLEVNSSFVGGTASISLFEMFTRDLMFVEVDVPQTGSVYARVVPHYGGSTGDFYKSVDGGLTWTFVVSTSSGNFGGIHRAGFHVGDVNTDLIYSPGNFLGYSQNGLNFNNLGGYSTSFGVTNGVETHPDIRYMEMLVHNGMDVLIVGNDGGLSISYDSGITWQSLNGDYYPTLLVFGLGTSEIEPDRFVAGSQDNHTYYRFNDDWVVRGSGDGGRSAIDPFDPNKSFERQNGNAYRVTYNPTNQSFASNHIGNSDYRTAIEPDPFIPNRVYMSNSNHTQLRSIDIVGNTETTTDLVSGFAGQIRQVAFCSSSPSDIYFISDGRNYTLSTADPKLTIWRSENFGNPGSWEDISSGNAGSISFPCTSIAVNPDNPEHIFTSFGGVNTDQSTGSRRVIITHDGGDNWINWDQGLPGLPVLDIEIQKSAGIIYAATDGGVYYRDISELTDGAGEGWKCFSEDLPLALTTDIDIINCSQELVVSSYGRGVWKTSLLPAPSLSITSDELWDTDRTIYSDIVVEDGVTLTITAELNMAAGKSISVLQGGTLVVNGGTITNSCGRAWNGIHVEGDPAGQYYSFANPGRAQIKNGAVIEHAGTALNNFILDQNGDIDWGTTGGYISATNSTFLNNKRDVQMLSYDNLGQQGAHLNDRSYFIKTDFIINDDFPFDSHVQHFTSYECNGFQIEGCTFHDQRTGINPWNKRNGLVLSASTVRLDEKCNSVDPNTGLCNDGVPTKFIDLNHGIKSYGQTHPLFMTEIKNSEFISNWNGVYLMNSRDAEVWNNDFEVTPIGFSPQGNKYIPYPTGIYLHHQTRQYSIEENSFYPEENSTEPTAFQAFGIVANTSHGDPTELFNNDIKHLTVGIESLGQNRTQDGPVASGLQLKCNSFDRNSTDIAIIKGTAIYDYYGLHEEQGGSGDPVLNDFVLDASLINVSNELYPTEDFISYFYDQNEPSELPVESFFDFNHATPQNPQNINLIPTDPPAGDKCPSMFDDDIVLLMSTQGNAKTSYEQQLDYLQEVLDGGDTEGLESDVQLTTNSDAWEKYLYLMSEEGFITEEVLKEVASKEDGFTQAMIRDILVANPHSAKSKEVENELNERTNQLPEYMINQIKEGLAETSPKEYLQMIQNQYYHQFVTSGFAIHHHLLRDSLPTDSLFLLLNSLEATGHASFDYQLVETYEALGHSDLVQQKIDLMQADVNYSQEEMEELSRFIEMKNQLNSWTTSNGEFIDFDDIQKNWLQEKAMTFDKAGAIAIGALMHVGEDDFDKPVILPESVQKSRRNKEQATESYSDILDVFPNPANDHITVSYSLKDFDENVTLRIIDVKGIVRWERTVYNRQDQLVIPLSLEQGQFTLELRAVDRTITSSKLQVH